MTLHVEFYRVRRDSRDYGSADARPLPQRHATPEPQTKAQKKQLQHHQQEMHSEDEKDSNAEEKSSLTLTPSEFVFLSFHPVGASVLSAAKVFLRDGELTLSISGRDVSTRRRNVKDVLELAVCEQICELVLSPHTAVPVKEYLRSLNVAHEDAFVGYFEQFLQSQTTLTVSTLAQAPFVLMRSFF